MPNLHRLSLSIALGVLVLAGTAGAKPVPAAKASPATTQGTAVHAMVAAANPLAAEAGLKILKQGGSAVDAAAAIQAVLGLVEPQSSGLGGGAFMTFYDGRTHKTIVYDGREKAPAAATPQYFFGDNGKPLNFRDAVLSGRSQGVPGAIAALYLAHKTHGRLPWSKLFGEAERLATEGFVVSPRLSEDINSKFFPQATTPDATAYFTKPGGGRYQTGDLLKNPLYAATIRKLAAEGPAAILKGKVAEDIIAKIHEGPNPGILTRADLASYEPTVDQPACRPYRAYVVCAPPPPGGGVGVLEILGILENTDIATRGPTTLRRGSSSWRPAGSPMPTETTMWATRSLFPCPWKACWIPRMTPVAPSSWRLTAWRPARPSSARLPRPK